MNSTQIIACIAALALLAAYLYLSVRRYFFLKNLKPGDKVVVDTNAGPRIAIVVDVFHIDVQVRMSCDYSVMHLMLPKSKVFELTKIRP